MAIVEMKKLTLIGLRTQQEELIEGLHRLGLVEIVNLKPLGHEGGERAAAIAELAAQLADLQFALDFIKRHAAKGKRGGRLTKREYEQLIAEPERAFAAVARARQLEGQLGELRGEESRLTTLIKELEPWREVPVPLNSLGHTKESVMALGSLPTDRLASLRAALAAQFPESYLEVVAEGKEETRLFLAYHRGVSQHLESLLRGNGWSPAKLDGLTGTPAALIEEANEALAQLAARQQELTAAAAELSVERPRLEATFDHLSIERERKQITASLVETEQTFMLEGWLPAHQEDHLRQALNQISGDYELLIRDADENEISPTLVENPRFVEPFEMITEMYSTPSSRSIDPNPFMAPFYFAFFGLMVSDAGYGLVMALAATLFIRLTKPQGGAKKLAGILAFGGISTLIWGALFGGWFGVSFEPILFSPMDSPLEMLGLCFGLGALHLFFGMGLEAYLNIRRGRPLAALFDQGLWFLFLIGLPLLAVPSLAAVGKVLAIGGAIGLILTQGRHQKGLVKKFFTGLLSLYNVTSYLSDILSYSRLFALGVATGVIGLVINTLAEMVGGSVVGAIFMVILLIGGHAFNMVINVLGAFVHASRLQYIEFFGKFFEGGGKPFAPFRMKTKYVEAER